ncbi:MAG: hypothetical protein ACOYN2_05220 [Patescibacteria group bacterium]
MGFFDFADQPATASTTTPATAIPAVAKAPTSEASDFLIITDDMTASTMPDTVAELATATPAEDTFVSAFQDVVQDSTPAVADIVTFDTTPAVETTEEIQPETVISDVVTFEEETPAEVAPETSIILEPETTATEEFSIADQFGSVVEAKEDNVVASEVVSDTMSLDKTLTDTIEKLKAGVAKDKEKIKALFTQKEDLIAQSERILAEATAKAEKLRAEATTVEEAATKIELDGARAKKVIDMLGKQISA